MSRLFRARLEEMGDMLTVQEVADIFRVDPSTVRKWVREGAIEAVALPATSSRQTYRIMRGTVLDMLPRRGQYM